MARAVAIGALLATLVLIVNAARNCYLLPSPLRKGKCIYVLRGAEKDKCMPTYAGFEYFPKSVQDMEEVRKVLYWNDIKDKKFLTGLWYKKNKKDLFFKVPSNQGNVWEAWSDRPDAALVDQGSVNFQLAPSKDNEQIVMELGDDKLITYTMTDTKDLPLLCLAHRRPALPCPTGYHIYRPTKRCFKLYMDGDRKNPIDADRICRQEHAIMGSVNNKEEDDYIGSFYPQTNVFLGMRFAWKSINAEYPNKNSPKANSPPEVFKAFIDKYMYNIDGHKIVYHNFYPSQPDFNTPNEFFIVKEWGGKWHDYNSNNHFNFFCATLPDQSGQA